MPDCVGAFGHRIRTDAELRNLVGTKPSGGTRAYLGWIDDVQDQDFDPSEFPVITYFAPTIDFEGTANGDTEDAQIQADIWVAPGPKANQGSGRLKAIRNRVVTLFRHRVRWTYNGEPYTGFVLPIRQSFGSKEDLQRETVDILVESGRC